MEGSLTRRKVMAMKLPEDRQLDAITQRNVVIQLEHLSTYPVVRESLEAGTLNIAGWVYDIEHGKVLEYHSATDTFEILQL